MDLVQHQSKMDLVQHQFDGHPGQRIYALMARALGEAHQVGQLACQHLGDAVNGHLPEYIAGPILAEGYAALQTLQEVQRDKQCNVHQRQRLQAVIVSLTALMARVKVASVIVGSGFADAEPLRWVECESAFASRIRTGAIINVGALDANTFLEKARQVFAEEMAITLRVRNAVKVNAALVCGFTLLDGDDSSEKVFNTPNAVIWQSTDLDTWFRGNVQDPLLRELEEFQERGSGWMLQGVHHLTVNINQYQPIRGSGYIELPQPILDRQACINVRTRGNDCFKWAVLSALFPAQRHAERLTQYTPYADAINTEGLVFPLMPRDVPKFEKLNPDISVSVYVLEKRKDIYSVLPYYVSRPIKARHVNLLLVQSYYIDEDEETESKYSHLNSSDEPIEYHYVWIKDLPRLVKAQVTKRKTRIHLCDRCLHFFYEAEKLAAHEKDCCEMNQTKPKMPEFWNKFVKFDHYRCLARVPFVIYADLECILKKVDQNEQQGKTKDVQKHEPFSIAYYLHCNYDDTLSGFHSYRGPDPACWFAMELMVISAWVQDLYDHPKLKPELTDQEKREFRAPNAECHICKKPLPSNLSERMQDHCHLTGVYRGPAHISCNMQYRDSRTIPVVFHNMSNYDIHFLIRDLATKIPGRTTVIPQTMEKYISVTKYIDGFTVHFRFIDSFRFMASSLEKLASYLPATPITRRQFSALNDDQFRLLTRKGVFPYEYVDSWGRLDEPGLPPKVQFFSHLTGSTVSDEDYEHAKNVWHTFGIKTLGEYADLYLKIDVLLLAEVFENFRETCMMAYGLDPAHYHTAPGLSWDAMLKITGQTLELLTDIDMLLFIERGIRGGVSQCSNRYAKANNPYIDTFDPSKPTNYLMYFDVNNLYGWAMTQKLPYGEFKWVDVGTCWDVPDSSELGYILEVDLAYPQDLHTHHQDLPFCPEVSAPPGSKERRLLTSLFKKERYIIHYKNLKQALDHGLRLDKIHRILQFKQSAWLKKYIDKNTEFRKEATNEFSKNFFKLMNNSVFGKTMESVRNRIDVKLVTRWEGRYGAEALIARPNFHSRSIFDQNLVAIQLKKMEVLMNKPIYVGFCVLDVSKTCLYNFHYSLMPKMFPNSHFKLLYTDTDSLIYDIECPDVYQVMKDNSQYFDTSDYPENNRFGIKLQNKKVIGLMKDECCGEIMTEFVGLRSKMYSIRVNNVDTMKKCKGIKSSVVKNTITFDDYLKCLRDNDIQTRVQYLFRSKLHNLYTIQQSKIALSPGDKKRCIRHDTTDTLPWGHKDLDPLDYMVAELNLG